MIDMAVGHYISIMRDKSKSTTFLPLFRRSLERVVNFGCNHGEETFRLMWALDSDEAFVIDIKKDNIEKQLIN